MIVRQVFSYTWKGAVLLLGLCLMALVAFIIRLNHTPYDLTPYLNHFTPYFAFKGYRLNFNTLDMYYDKSLVLRGGDVQLMGPDGARQLGAKRVEMTLSNRNLVRGNVVAKHIQVDDLDVDLSINRDGITFAGLNLRKKDDKAQRLALIPFLNRDDHSRYYQYLKTLSLHGVNITIEDTIHARDWAIQDATFSFSKFFSDGEELSIHGTVLREDKQTSTPTYIRLQHPYKADTAKISFAFKQTDTSILDDYLPQNLSSFLRAEGEVELIATLLDTNRLIDPRFRMALKNGAFYPEAAYSFPLPFQEATLEGRYDEKGTQTFYVDRFDMLDEEGMEIHVTGEVRDMSTRPHIDLTFTSPKATFSHFLNYLPDGRIPVTVSWLKNRMNHATVENIRLHYNGVPQNLPTCEKECGFDGSFDFSGLSIQFLDGVSPGVGLAGRYEMKEDYIYITSPDGGTLGNQRVKDVSVRIDGLFHLPRKEKITIAGTAHGPLGNAVDLIHDALKAPKTNLPTMQGNHISQVELSFPLGKEEMQLDDFDFNVASDLVDVSTTINDFGALPFFAPVASLSANKRQLTFLGNGTLDDVPVHAKWVEEIAHFQQKTKLNLDAAIPAEKLQPFVEKARSSIEGTVPAKLMLEKINASDYSYTLESSLSPATLNIEPFNWQKEAAQKLKLESTGMVSRHGKRLHAEVISLTGPDVEVLGSYFKENDAPHENRAQFSPLNIGNHTKLHVTYTPSSLEISGPSVDLRQLKLKEFYSLPKREQTEGTPLRFDTSLDIERILLQNGELASVKGIASTFKGEISSIDMAAKLKSGEGMKVTLIPREGGERTISLQTQNAGETLRIFDVYKDLRQGQLIGQVKLAPIGQSEVLSGVGHIDIHNARLVKAPLLAQLLSLVSLEELFSSKEGILFEDTRIPFTMKGPIVTVDEVMMKGPSIGLRFRGKINTNDDTMSVKGRLIPAAGVNNVFGKIPLVGKILTGSQEGLIVADFSIKGPLEKPNVSVNPLSVVTPGILKDFFSVFTGDDMPEPPKKEEVKK